jgi:thioredoxin:protein disulfide reductase
MVKLRALLLITLSLFLAACSRENGTSTPSATNASSSPEEKRISSVGVVKVSQDEITISPGGIAEARIRLNIDNGFHVNANPPTFPYLKPTELELKSDNGISVGTITYAKPLKKTFPFADVPLAIYEGETIITVTLKADNSAKPGRQNLSGVLRVQACDDRVCYPPGEKDIAIPLEVK